jgi:uncharacterized protein HemX
MLAGLYAKLIGAGILVVALIGGYLYVSHLQTSNAEQAQRIIILQAQVKGLGDQLVQQNAAVEKLKTEGEARLAQAQKDLEAAKAEAAKHTGKATVIYRTLPSVPGKSCEADRQSALDLMNGGSK